MTSLIDSVRAGFLAKGLPAELVNELLDSFVEAKQRFYKDDLRPTAIEGGRFSEATFRVLEWATTTQYSPIGTTLVSVDRLLTKLENSSGPESVRIHIPRTLRLIYDIRNRRDVAHLGDGIDPNVQDASLVIRNMEWVLAELVRLYHSISAAEAHAVINDLISKEVPAIQVFNGFPRLLKTVGATDYFLALLYWRGAQGASRMELVSWVKPTMRNNATRTLNALDLKNHIHFDGAQYFLTLLGEQYVESSGILGPS